jgi:hypothetical protein
MRLLLVAVLAGACAMLASRFMWWATKRSTVWAMAAGVLLAVIVVGGAVAIAWAITRATYGP